MYLEEAHPTDGWMYGAVTHQIEQHTSLDGRVAAARTLCGELRERGAAALPLYVDLLENAASYAFGALPERLVVLHRGRVAFIGGKGPEEYSVDQLEAFLRTL